MGEIENRFIEILDSNSVSRSDQKVIDGILDLPENEKVFFLK